MTCPSSRRRTRSINVVQHVHSSRIQRRNTFLLSLSVSLFSSRSDWSVSGRYRPALVLAWIILLPLEDWFCLFPLVSTKGSLFISSQSCATVSSVFQGPRFKVTHCWHSTLLLRHLLNSPVSFPLASTVHFGFQPQS